MPMLFENDPHFDPATDDAIIWGNDRQFRLLITAKFLMDNYGLEKRFDHAGAEAIIQKNRVTFERLAQAAHDTGKSELIVE